MRPTQLDDHFIGAIAPSLELGNDGIWYSSRTDSISYPDDGNDTNYLLEERSFWFRHRNLCIQTLISVFPPTAKVIFDIGGGNGYVTKALAQDGFAVVLVEPGQRGALNARRRGLEQVICATLDGCGFRHGSLPAVGLFDVIEHVPNDVEFLKRLRDNMMLGGMLYATVPAYSALWSSEDEAAGHFRRYTRRTLSQCLIDAGFDVRFVSYIFWPLPLPIAILRSVPWRLGLGKAPTLESARSDHGADSPLISKCAETLLSCEVRAIRNHRALPFGASCLVAASRRK